MGRLDCQRCRHGHRHKRRSDACGRGLAAEEDGSAVTFDLATIGNDVDSDDDGTTLSYAITGTPSEGTASITGTTLTFDPGADFQDLALKARRGKSTSRSGDDTHGRRRSPMS